MKNYTFPRELGEKWITALKSGEYQQYQGRLHNKETCSYCVLGVLGKVMGIKDKVLSENTYLRYLITDERVSSFLMSPTPSGSEFYVEQYLTRQNDLKDNYWTFDQFANWLEQNLEFV